ncbi:MAG: HAMP domain-containing protein [Chloroflexales bacterium]|nr:HAMP domain-containing protein [Chloroflexales bacterium]
MMRHLGLTPRLALVFVLFAAALLAGVSALAYANGRAALLASTTADLLSTAHEKEAALASWIEHRQADMAALAASPRLRADLALLLANPDTAAARAAHNRLVAELQPRVTSGGTYLSLMLIEPVEGQVIAATDPAEEGKFKEDRPYFLEGMRHPYVQNVYYAIGLQGLAMTASAPVTSADGRLLAVLAGRLNLAEMSAIISRHSGLHQSDDAFLINPSSLFVTQPYMLTDPVVLQRGIHTEASRRCLAGQSGTLLADDYRGVPTIIVHRWLAERQLCLIVKVDQSEAFVPARAFGAQLLLISALLLVVASGVAIGLARTITRPVLALQAGATRFSQGDRSVTLPITSGDELGMLARTFNTMAAAIGAHEAQLRDYAGQLEHRVAARTAELQVAQTRLQRLVDANIIGVAIAGAGGEIFEANDYYLDMLGVTRHEFACGQVRWSDVTPPEHLPADQRALAELAATGVCTPYEKEYLRRDGTRVWVMIADAVLPQEDGSMIALVQNITDRKHAEQELARQADDLRRSNAELQQFAYVASHDLQEPLRMVSSYTQLLARRYKGRLDADADEFIAYAVDGASRMQTLINDLLTYSRVGTRGKPFTPVDCKAALEQAITNLKLMSAEHGALITHAPLPTVLADAPQLVQLFQNLLSNGIKYHGAEPPCIHVAAEARGAEWIFSVCDNGIGIEPQYAERIFIIFQRLHTRAEYPGTGIGLAICKKIVERHGGRIWVESQPDQGATFYFSLPQHGDASQ